MPEPAACPTCGHVAATALSDADTDAYQRRVSLERSNPSKCASVMLVFIGAVQSVLTSGVVFGWAPLQMMLQEEGIYGEVCVDGPPCQVSFRVSFLPLLAPLTLAHPRCISHRSRKNHRIKRCGCS